MNFLKNIFYIFDKFKIKFWKTDIQSKCLLKENGNDGPYIASYYITLLYLQTEIKGIKLNFCQQLFEEILHRCNIKYS